ncbi:MAG: hypothetical protein K0R83_3038, partial [Caulobacter sp.]|nr:hypothetical protein [Caulobacter sp.]
PRLVDIEAWLRDQAFDLPAER